MKNSVPLLSKLNFNKISNQNDWLEKIFPPGKKPGQSQVHSRQSSFDTNALAPIPTKMAQSVNKIKMKKEFIKNRKIFSKGKNNNTGCRNIIL